MNFARNMEAVFLVTILAAGFTAFATADVRPAAPAAAPVATEGKIATVVVSTKRLTAEQKARLGS